MGIPHEILIVIQQMYAKNEAQVKIGKRTSIGYTTELKNSNRAVDCHKAYSRFTQKVYCTTGTGSAKEWDCQ